MKFFRLKALMRGLVTGVAASVILGSSWLSARELEVNNTAELINALEQQDDLANDEVLTITLLEGDYSLDSEYENFFQDDVMLPVIRRQVVIEGNNQELLRTVGGLRSFYVQVDGALTLNNLIFRVGNAVRSRRVGINNQGSLVVDECHFDRDIYSIYNSGQMRIMSSLFSDVAELPEGVVRPNLGRAIQNIINAEAEIYNSKFVNLKGVDFAEGGAILNHGQILIFDSTFEKNKSYHGGAISSQDDGTTLIFRSTFRGNISERNGGAILFENNRVYDYEAVDFHIGKVSIYGSTFYQNVAGSSGGAFYIDCCSDEQGFIIENSTFVSNQAQSTAGAVYMNGGGNAYIRNSIFVRNSASRIGGIYGPSDSIDEVGGSKLRVANSIILANVGGDTPNCTGNFIINGPSFFGRTNCRGDLRLVTQVGLNAERAFSQNIIAAYVPDTEESRGAGHFPLVCSEQNVAINNGNCDAGLFLLLGEEQYSDQFYRNALAACDIGSVELRECDPGNPDPDPDPIADRDGDTVPDDADNCPDLANADQADSDADGLGDVCDAVDPDPDPIADRDGDTVPDATDNCPDFANADQEDSDADGIGDECDADGIIDDRDGDLIPDEFDNCPDVSNLNQLDSDLDGTGDACENGVGGPGGPGGEGASSSSGGCSLNPQATQNSTAMMGLFAIFALTLMGLRSKQQN